MDLSVLIVDDERWMRDTIEKSIDWELYGIRVAGKAVDGLQAYDMILALRPDIVLADIKMPGMDGIDLLRRVKENGMAPAFIFFSGYDRFEYAKDAVNLGAMGYILKPVDEHELLGILLKAKEHIESERQKSEAKTKLVDLSERENDRKKTEYIRRLLDGMNIGISGFQNTGLLFASNYFSVVLLEIDNYSDFEKTDTFKKGDKLKLALSTLCSDYFESEGIRMFADNSRKGFEILLNPVIPYESAEQHKLIEICEKIINTFKTSMGYSVTIGIGRAVSEIESIHLSYRKAVKALEHKILFGGGRVIEYRDIFDNGIRTIILDRRMEKDILESFEKTDFTISQKIIEQVAALINIEGFTIDDLREFNYNLIELVYRILNKAGISTETHCINAHLLYDELNRCEVIVELYKKYSLFINDCLQLVSNRNLNYYKKLADNIKKYIHDNYAKDISLESVAQDQAFHPNYISRIFKEEFGENFIDYLTNYRIAIARDLLKDIRNNVSDVSGMVGYSNPKYFSKVFKKITGITPMEYIGKNK